MFFIPFSSGLAPPLGVQDYLSPKVIRRFWLLPPEAEEDTLKVMEGSVDIKLFSVRGMAKELYSLEVKVSVGTII